jgi:hypothetical protein
MSPRRSGRIVTCTAAECRSRRDQARAFLQVAELVLSEGRREAHVAAALAVLAGIAATDAICGPDVRTHPARWPHGRSSVRFDGRVLALRCDRFQNRPRRAQGHQVSFWPR